MSRYAVSGAVTAVFTSTESVTGGSGSPTSLRAGQNLLGTVIPTERVLWLRSLWAFQDVSAGGALHLLDATADNTDVTESMYKASIGTASGDTTLVDFPAPGLKFVTGCVVSPDTSASNVWGIGRIGGSGYYE